VEEFLKDISIIIVTSFEYHGNGNCNEELIRMCREIEFEYIDNDR
jgi:hypothetical protein